jgi:hypothetical protein
MSTSDTRNFYTIAFSTSIAEILTLPICTVKTRFQTNLHYTSISQVAKDIYTLEGMKGFYRSSSASLTSQVLTTSLKYTSYQALKKYNGSNTFIANALNGVLGGFITSLIVHPIDVIKINQQMNTFSPRSYMRGGLRTWYKGYTKTIAKNTFGSILFFPIYDTFKSYLHNPLTASFCTSIIATTLLHPIDLFKTRHIGNQKDVYMISNSKQPLKALFRGLHINLLRAVPHFTIAMTLAEKIKDSMK